MELYNLIASWSGWPPIVGILIIVGSFGIWFYQKHTAFLKDEINSLSRKLQECQQNFTLDVVAKRLADRHKILTQELEMLDQDRENSELRIKELENELRQMKEEADDLRLKMAAVQEILVDMDLPREGKFRPEIARDILQTAEYQKAIIIPVNPMRESGETNQIGVEENYPYKIGLDFPGMFKMYLPVFGKDDSLIGLVTNLYWNVYDKDYYETLLKIINIVPNEDVSHSNHSPYADSITFFPTSKFHSFSPIVPFMYYIKIPFNNEMAEKIRYLLGLK